LIETQMTNTIFCSSEMGALEIKVLDEKIVSINFTDNSFPNTTNNEKLPLLIEAKKQMEAFLLGKLKTFTLPLTYNGTEFENKVWKLLTEIPYGRTISYGELAQQMGDKNLSRAVGTANGKNFIPIIIPCHRVIGQNGNLTGYSGGLWRKKWLLDHENRIQNGVLEIF
jgi:O-6-methylguanine DNA methyltransferase